MQRKFNPKGMNAKQKKQFYKKQFQSSKRNEEVKNGIVGFLATCDQNKEQRCIKELFNILNDFVEKVYPDLDIQELANQHQEHVKKQKAEKKEAQEKAASKADPVQEQKKIDEQPDEELKEPPAKRPRLDEQVDAVKGLDQEID